MGLHVHMKIWFIKDGVVQGSATTDGGDTFNVSNYDSIRIELRADACSNTDDYSSSEEDELEEEVESCTDESADSM